ncbi:ComEA family DNA-binding protein [Arthrobacter echini]|uniref:ComEA family DNA-binding protein n=1 Tax=Arthrobacter echini TaxID=1529066 RepID=A0A4S5E691_9MICC|nr:ComEA family DNA-binding protein [Arthrobacter echini]THJ67085.1 ComEA family DNA-binding protein [Arthrobacter echini]
MAKHRWPTADGGRHPSSAGGAVRPEVHVQTAWDPYQAEAPSSTKLRMGPDADLRTDTEVSLPVVAGSSAGSPAPRIRSAVPPGYVPDEEDTDRGTGWEDPRATRGLHWRVYRSAALIFLGVALAVGAALFLVRSSEPSAAAISVELDADRPGGSDTGASGTAPDTSATTPSPTAGVPVTASGAAGSSPGHGSADSPIDAPLPGPDGDGTIVVYVTGAVATPGVVTIRAGTRLAEVLEDAGGALPEADLESINLASPPFDGQHIHVLAVGEEPRADLTEQGITASSPTVAGAQGSGGVTASGGPTSGGAPGAGTAGADGAAAALIDINTATLAELETLPRVGPVLGQRLINWREDNGPFLQAADIDAVPGIGPAMLEGILPLIVAR